MAGRPASKRRKTPLACENCRRHKIKCSGDRPVCSNCSNKRGAGNHCIWKHVDGRIEDFNTSAGVVQRLEQRIQHLERQAISSSSHTTLYAAEPSSGSGSGQVFPERPSGISAMEGAVTGVAQSEGFIGSASAASFMSLIRQAVDPAAALMRNTSLNPHLTLPPTPSHPPPLYDLPQRRMAERLATAYWDYIHPLHPFLYKPHVEDAFRRLWTGEPPPEAQSPLTRTTEANSACVVYLVLALGCQYYDSSEDGDDISQGPKPGAAFFERAQSVFQHDIANGTNHSLQPVQIMLLMAQYLSGTGSTQKSWEVMGLAIRICQGLGLHRGATSDEKVLADPVEREIAKRVWHECLMVERMLCMTLGRPAMLGGLDVDPVPLPTELDEESFQSGMFQTSAEAGEPSQGWRSSGPSILSFFVRSAKLSEIVQQILLAFYADDNADDAREPREYFMGHTSIFSIDAQIMDWLATIPAHIQLDSYSGSKTTEPGLPRILRRQAVVLRVRFLLARIYLFRPVLSKTCITVRNMHTQSSTDATVNARNVESLSHQTALRCSMLCVRAAVETIDTINAHLTTAAAWGQKPSWLYGVWHIYLAATVLLASRLAPVVLLGEISQQEIQDSWNRALDILGRFQADNVSARRCVAALRVLYQKLPGVMSASREPQIDLLGQTATDLEESHVPVDTPSNEQILHDWGLMEPPHGDLVQDLDPDWMPEFNFSEPYDMSWFHITAPGLHSV